MQLLISNVFGPVTGKIHLENVKFELGRLFAHYAAENGSSNPGPNLQRTFDAAAPSTSTADCDQEVDECLLTVEEFNEKYQNREGNNGAKKTELDRYLDEDVDPYTPEFDVLTWWKVHSARFPALSEMAKDVLAVPISTVASESAFSTGGRVISDYRSSLNCETVQALICAQDWLRPRSDDDAPDEFEELDLLVELEQDVIGKGKQPMS